MEQVIRITSIKGWFTVTTTVTAALVFYLKSSLDLKETEVGLWTLFCLLRRVVDVDGDCKLGIL